MAVTAAHILDINPAKATGNVMEEIFEPSLIESLIRSELSQLTVFPNPVTTSTRVTFDIQNKSDITIKLINSIGQSIGKRRLGNINRGKHSLEWKDLGFGRNQVPGIYFLSLTSASGISTYTVLIGG